MTGFSQRPETVQPPRDARPPAPGRPGASGWAFGWRKGGDLDRRAALALGAVLTVAWLVAAAYLALSSYTLLRARHVQSLREELLSLQQENASLEARIGERLSAVIQTVAGMGFVPAAVEIVSP